MLTDNGLFETASNIYRSIGAGTKVLLATVGPDIASYSDASATGNVSTTTYSYSVEACVDQDCSVPTNTAIVPYKPINLTVAATSPSQINLAWTDASSNETGFQINRKTGDCSSSASWKSLKNTAANVSAYSNTGLTSQSTYAYRVRAYTKSNTTPYAYGYSSWSNCSATTTP